MPLSYSDLQFHLANALNAPTTATCSRRASPDGAILCRRRPPPSRQIEHPDWIVGRRGTGKRQAYMPDGHSHTLVFSGALNDSHFARRLLAS